MNKRAKFLRLWNTKWKNYITYPPNSTCNTAVGTYAWAELRMKFTYKKRIFYSALTRCERIYPGVSDHSRKEILNEYIKDSLFWLYTHKSYTCDWRYPEVPKVIYRYDKVEAIPDTLTPHRE